MLHSTERSFDLRSEHIPSSIYALWEHGHELLEGAAVELSVDLVHDRDYFFVRRTLSQHAAVCRVDGLNSTKQKFRFVPSKDHVSQRSVLGCGPASATELFLRTRSGK